MKYLRFVYYPEFLIKASEPLSHHKSLVSQRFNIGIVTYTNLEILWSIVIYLAYCGISCLLPDTTHIHRQLEFSTANSILCSSETQEFMTSSPNFHKLVGSGRGYQTASRGARIAIVLHDTIFSYVHLALSCQNYTEQYKGAAAHTVTTRLQYTKVRAGGRW
jgi:hypothetical protein